jgi:hypothetical protein
MLEFTIDRGYDGIRLEDARSVAQSDEGTPYAFIPAVANLGGLPTEIILAIAAYLPHQKDIASLVYQNRRLYHLLRDTLFRRNIETEGSSALLWAAAKNRVDLAKDLLEAGADTRAEIQGCFTRRTPLNEACRNGNIEMAKLLVDAGADVFGPPDHFWQRQTGRYQKPLFIAMATRQVALCHVLISRLSGEKLESLAYETAFPWWAWFGVPRRYCYESGQMLLQLAATYGLPTVVAELFERGAVARSTPGSHWTRPIGSPLQLWLQGDWADPKKQDDYLQTVMLLLERWDGVKPEPVRVSDERFPTWSDQIRFTDPKGWKGFEDPVLLGRYHKDPRVRVLFSRDEFPFEKRGVGEKPAGYWITGITPNEEARLLESAPAEALFDLGMFKLDRKTRKLRLDRAFPPAPESTGFSRGWTSCGKLCQCISVANLIFTGRNCATDCAGLEHGVSR